MERPQLCAAADRNVVTAIGHFARCAEGAVLTDTGSSVLVASATGFTGAFHDTATGRGSVAPFDGGRHGHRDAAS